MVLALLASLALHQVSMPGAAEQERFKSYFQKGEELYTQGEYGAAIWNFRMADSIRVTPEVAFDLAKCHEKLADIAFATFWYRQYLKRAPNANDALDVAERVGTVLARAEGEGRGLLELSSPGAIDLVVNKVRFAEPPVAMFLPPGEYEVAARFPSGVKTMVTQIRTGKTSPVTFEPLPPPLLDSTSDEPLVIGKAPSRPTNKVRLLGIISAGLGVVGLGVGIPFGIMSTSNATRCCSMDPSMLDPSLKTQTDRERVANEANSQAIIGNAGVIAGAVLLAAGALLIILSIMGVGG